MCTRNINNPLQYRINTEISLSISPAPGTIPAVIIPAKYFGPRLANDQGPFPFCASSKVRVVFDHNVAYDGAL